MIAVAIFLVAPLRLTSTIPAETGAFAPLFAALEGVVGKPYNLAPSLHIALLVILWEHYARHVPARWHLPMHLWAGLIGVSVLTAYQHHFFDVPTGAMLGFLCLWLWPAQGDSPVAAARLVGDRRRWRLAALYLTGAGLFVALAAGIGGWALWLLWPGQSLALVAVAYAGIGAALFQKAADGRMSLAARALLWPYILGARINARAWGRGDAPVAIAAGVGLGPVPRRQPPGTVVIDLAAELPAPGRRGDWRAVPMLDLAAPAPDDLCRAARGIERARASGQRVLVSCALGRGRSAAAAAVWLVAYGGAPGVDAAIKTLRARRPQIVLRSADTRAIGIATSRLAVGTGMARCLPPAPAAVRGNPMPGALTELEGGAG